MYSLLILSQICYLFYGEKWKITKIINSFVMNNNWINIYPT